MRVRVRVFAPLLPCMPAQDVNLSLKRVQRSVEHTLGCQEDSIRCDLIMRKVVEQTKAQVAGSALHLSFVFQVLP